MLRLLIALCLPFAMHIHTRPHLSVHIAADRPIRLTTFAISGHGPDLTHTWLLPPNATRFVLLRPCGGAFWVGVPVPGDFNGDGKVDLKDYMVFSNLFGR